MFLTDFDLGVCFSSAVGFSQMGGVWRVWSTPVPAGSHESSDGEKSMAVQPASLMAEQLPHQGFTLVLGIHTFSCLVQPRVRKVEERAQSVRLRLSSTSTNPALFSPEESDS